MSRRPWLTLVTALALAFAACEEADRAEDETLDADTVAVDDEDLGDDIGDAVEETGEAIEEGVEETGEAIEEGVEETGEAIEEGAEKANP